MKIIVAFIAFFSWSSFSQTSSGEEFFQTPDFVVSGMRFESITGCWARIYEQENLTGRSISIVGYTTWADISGTDWPNWNGRVNSAEVGPGARLILYGSPYFSNEDHIIASGVSVTDLPRVPNDEGVKSLKLLCDPN